MNRHVNVIPGRLSLRPPQRHSLEPRPRHGPRLVDPEGHQTWHHTLISYSPSPIN
jgi:hypothetical protein